MGKSSKAAKAKAKAEAVINKDAVKVLKAETEADKLAEMSNDELEEFQKFMMQEFNEKIKALQEQLARETKQAEIKSLQQTKQAEIDVMLKQIDDIKNTPSPLSKIDNVKPSPLVESESVQKPNHSWADVTGKHIEVVSVQNSSVDAEEFKSREPNHRLLLKQWEDQQYAFLEEKKSHANNRLNARAYAVNKLDLCKRLGELNEPTKFHEKDITFGDKKFFQTTDFKKVSLPEYLKACNKDFLLWISSDSDNTTFTVERY